MLWAQRLAQFNKAWAALAAPIIGYLVSEGILPAMSNGQTPQELSQAISTLLTGLAVYMTPNGSPPHIEHVETLREPLK